MPKRRNPFGDDSPLQFKTHVRTKELNAGISGEHAMKSVYDRTKDLLFSGAKKNLYDSPMMMDANENHPMIPNNNNNNIILPPGTSFVQDQGQMVMTHQGHLTVPSASGDHDEMDTHPSSSTSQSDSKCEKKYTWDFSKKKAQPPGQLKLSPTKERCNFCEKVFLGFNTVQCCTCNGTFCQLCSTTNYDESTERIFCLSCSP